MQEIPLRITSDAFTQIDSKGKPTSVAIDWKDLDALKDFLADRLTTQPAANPKRPGRGETCGLRQGGFLNTMEAKP